MDISKQCCTLDQAKRLKELGVCQESLYYWSNLGHLNECYLCRRNGAGLYYDEKGWFSAIHFVEPAPQFTYSAFTVAELGAMLPHPDGMAELGGFNHPSDFDPTAKDGKPWYCMWEYDTDKYGMKRQLFEGETEAEARAAILIYFLEINLIQVDAVNLRLKAA